MQEEHLQEIEIAIRNNECSQMIEKLKNDLALLETKKKHIEEKLRVLKEQTGLAIQAIKTVGNITDAPSAQAIYALNTATTSMSERNAAVSLLDKTLTGERERLYRDNADIKNQMQSVSEDLIRLGKEIDN